MEHRSLEFIGADENTKNKNKRSLSSCGSNEDGMLSFVSDMLTSSSTVKSGGGAFIGVDSDHSDLDASVIREVGSRTDVIDLNASVICGNQDDDEGMSLETERCVD
ncbi:hypothetical protein L2E82_22129 [Cichorium intybus]|uniref:Uncharacterized protein n=1 Tax=Cichorium intybus TaxID=13427 RepID=A0ACB9DXB1_CICIN|nr:hypothetical protein L2E82_22129 [Cichorium intybus]